jgi:arsenate reductase (thioredoxin)
MACNILGAERSDQTMAGKTRILFLCTGNSCRSQMAEAWTRSLQGEQFEAYSAGVAPKAVDPRAIKAMAEAGIDISGQKSKDVDALGNMEFDYVITLCDNARESCPYFPAKTRLIHRGFDDPPKLAEGAPNEERAMEPYRRVRDEIRAFVKALPAELNAQQT